MLLLTAYSAILERWSKNKSFLINIPFFNRKTEYKGLEDVIADFTTLLLLEINCEGNPTFLELLDRIQKQLHEDMKYTTYSGVQVQRDLTQMYGDISAIAPIVFACNLGTELVNSTFTENFGSFSYMISQTPQVWNDFQSYEDENGVQLTWDTIDELFPEDMIDDMLTSFEQLLHNLRKEDWNQRFDVLPERQKNFVRKECTIPAASEQKVLFQEFFENVERSPERIAIIDTGKELEISYSRLKEMAQRVAAGIIKRNIKEESIAITIPRGYEQIVAVLAVLISGNVYVPVSCEQPSERRKLIHEKTDIHILKGSLHSFASFCAGKIQVVKRFPKILALAIFGNGMNKKQREKLYSSLCGESTNLLFERINECKLETSIKWILPTKDRALNPKQQRVYMNNIGNIKSIIKLTAPHDVMISHPEEVAKILLEN